MATSIIHCGFEYGAGDALGADTGLQGSEIFGSWGAGASVISTDSRSGTYCAEMGLTGTGYFGWDTADFGSGFATLVATFYMKISTDPTADAVSVFRFLTGNGNLILRYNQSDDTVDWIATTSSSTSAKSSVTIPVNTWHRIDVRADISANPWVIDWQVDGTDQTQFSPAQVASTHTGIRFASGGDAGGSGTGRWDDVVVSSTSADYPLGEHKVVLLTPTACTATNSANFNTFTANGTMAAWNATTAVGAIDEVPPVTGASADGFAQITLSATDYVAVDMSTYTLQGSESITGVRMLACGWAASATAATIGFRSYNGTTERTLFATADPAFDNAATPAWVCEMCTLADFDTQSELDALVFRVGFSGDATPDVGIHAIYAEVAIDVPPAAVDVYPRLKRRVLQAVNRSAVH